MVSSRPVIPGFHPDPSVCRVGADYYLVTSSFEFAPGVPIFHSRDLVSWRQIGHVLDRPELLDITRSGASGGIFAPTIRHDGVRFWMITTNWDDGLGHLIVHADDPGGPWSVPVRIPSLHGIDPDLAWDEDGTCLMTYTGVSDLGAGIHQVAIDPSTGEVLDTSRRLWSGSGGKFPEGPHLYRIGAWWYLLVAEGGTERGHAVSIARGPSARGPFDGNPANPILTARGTDSAVQSTGHADLVERADGTWAMVYHGVRPRGSSPEWHVLGRETFAAEVYWADGWPAPGAPMEPATASAVITELTGPGWPVDWVAASGFPSESIRWVDGAWVLDAPLGPGQGGTGDAPQRGATAYVGRRQAHLHARATARLSSTGTGALSWRIDARHAIEVEIGDGQARAVWVIGDVRHVLGQVAADGIVTLRIDARPSDGPLFSTLVGPDLLVAGVEAAEGFVELGRIDGRYVATEVAGGMTGRLVGIAATAGSTTIHAFRYEGSDDLDQLTW